MIPTLSQRGTRPVVRVRPSAAFLASVARGECYCRLIDAKDRPCRICAARRAIADRGNERRAALTSHALRPGEVLALVFVAAIVLAAIVAAVVGTTTEDARIMENEVAKP